MTRHDMSEKYSLWRQTIITHFSVTDCDNGTYGLDCKGECGHCLDNMTCNKIDGSCSMGCVSGYSGKYCHSGMQLD